MAGGGRPAPGGPGDGPLRRRRPVVADRPRRRGAAARARAARARALPRRGHTAEGGGQERRGPPAAARHAAGPVGRRYGRRGSHLTASAIGHPRRQPLPRPGDTGDTRGMPYVRESTASRRRPVRPPAGGHRRARVTARPPAPPASSTTTRTGQPRELLFRHRTPAAPRGAAGEPWRLPTGAHPAAAAGLPCSGRRPARRG
ncbi:hypothetical protein SGPA1_11944 [Streptomyces misionensis JCM 4497]